mgnify:CR=1 FL=1
MAFVTRKPMKEKYIHVLIGPSGSGKTTYGQNRINKFASKNKVMFLSTGLELRKENVISAWQEPNMTAIKDFCHSLINETFANFKSSETHEILILDCVKDLEDAEYVATEATKHGLQVTRALLFDDIGPEELDSNWRTRGQDKDLFRGSAHAYLQKWNMKSNSLINFYKKSNILSSKSINNTHVDKFKGLGYLKRSRQDFATECLIPILPCPNNLSVVLTSSIMIKEIFDELSLILKVSQLKFTLPASFVHCRRDVTWVANPSRYYVTPKADGVRCILTKIQKGTFLITRKNEIYPCRIADDKLPVNTVLDGELLPSTSISDIHTKVSKFLCTSVFLVFDALAISGDILWMWPFTVRQESLQKLSLSKDITAVMEQVCTDSKLQSVYEENSPKKLLVNCVLKEHTPSVPDDVLKFLGAVSQHSYPCDGLIFTPNTAYVFGPDPLLFKWQSEDSIHCDILLDDLKFGKRECAADLFHHHTSLQKRGNVISFHGSDEFSLHGREVLECQWNKLHKAWDPLFVRRDKSLPNSKETIDHVETICQQPYSKEYFTADLTNLSENYEEIKSSQTPVNHPLVGYSFDELYVKLTELVSVGYVEKTIDSDTQLEILNYSISVRNPLISLCRGLVLHPDSKTIVTKPFVRFFEDVEEFNPNELVEATIKYDGTLGIAFVWEDEVRVTTRRRMNSEQALWAKQWINGHCNLTMFQSGYTYLFEIIYQTNTVIVNYLFEGLVLLAINDEGGHELSYDEVLCTARNIGFFMVTPRITALYSEILWYCGGIDLTTQESMPPNYGQFFSGALPVNCKRQEGWVVKFKDGMRQKIVYSWWKEASGIASLVHPQIVWLLVKHDKIKEVLGNVPNHILVEINRIIQALGRKFLETVKHVEEYLMKLRNVSRETGGGNMWRLDRFMVKQSETFFLDDNMDANNVMASDLLTREDDDEYVEDDSLTVRRSFVKLARKLDRHFEMSARQSQLTCEDVNLSPVYNRQKKNFLRLPVLDHMFPTSPVLDGYEPSDNFKQTWCKGWKTCPINQMQFIQEVLQKNHSNPPFLQLPHEVIVLFLNFLDGKTLAIVSKVCMKLRHIVRSSRALRERISVAEKAHTLLISNMTIEWSEDKWYRRRYNDFSSYDYWSGSGSY